MGTVQQTVINLEKQEELHARSIAIRITNLSKTFFFREKDNDSIRNRLFNLFSKNNKRELKALQNINLEIREGDFFGILGHNGSGKSTLLKMIAGAFPSDKGGRIELNGKVIRLALGMGFDPGLTARENIYVNASILGLTFKRIGERFNEIIEFAELEKFVDTPVKFYSSGMRSRLSFAIAIHADADIYLLDEFFGGVGDTNFRKKSEEVFSSFIASNKTFVHVSHNIGTIRKHCNRVLVLHKGEMVGIYSAEKAIEIYHELMKKK